MSKSFLIWLRYTNNSFQQNLANRSAVIFIMAAKILRIGLFLVFLNFIFSGARDIAGYNRVQIIFFYLSFNLVDTLAQMFFREVYRFRSMVVSGNLDYVLAKPLNPLLRVLLGGGDPFDLIMLVLLLSVVIWYAVNFIHPSISNICLYIFLILNGLMIAAAFHIFVLGIGILTITVDHLILIYRDLTSMVRIPVDLYIEPIKSLLTFVLPLGLMITIPAKALLGLLSWPITLTALAFGFISFYLSLKFWDFSLKKYSSASS